MREKRSRIGIGNIYLIADTYALAITAQCRKRISDGEPGVKTAYAIAK